MVFLMVSEKLLLHVTTASGQFFRIVFEQHLKSILEICIHKLLRFLQKLVIDNNQDVMITLSLEKGLLCESVLY